MPRKVILLGFLFAVSFLAILMINNKTVFFGKKTSNIPVQLENKQMLPGKIILMVSTGNIVALNSTVDVQVKATGGEKQIVGYDVNLSIDKNFLEFVEVNNLIENNFDVFTTEKDNQLIITGIKKLESEDRIIFNETPIINLKFRTLKKGKTKISLIREKESKKDSNLISAENVDILDSVNELTLSIGDRISLTKENEFVLEDGVTIILKDFDQAKEECRDCLTFANLTVEKDGVKKDLEFKVGGFAGYMIDQLEVFNHIFFLTTVQKNQVTFLIL